LYSIKTFLFQFVNSFTSLFYTAFVKPFIASLDPCEAKGNCMYELQVMLASIFITTLIVGSSSEIAAPLLFWLLKKREIKRSVDAAVAADKDQILRRNGKLRPSTFTHQEATPFFSGGGGGQNPSSSSSSSSSSSGLLEADEMHRYDITEVEHSFIMPTYDVMLGPFGDYARLAIQFGYTTMFVQTFPLACLMSFVNNYVEMRVCAWKMSQLYKRPEPRSIENIGTWLSILEVISIIAVFVNSGLVAFTGTYTYIYVWPIRIWIFILMSAGLLFIKGLLAFVIPDVPAEVEIQLKRQKFIKSRVIENISSDDAPKKDHTRVPPRYLVGLFDNDPM
jgi:anoctamin-10/anoctamin-7